MRHTIIFLLFLFISSVAVLSSDFSGDNIQQIYSGWMWEGGNFTSENTVFWVSSAGSDGMRISISYDKKTVLVYNDSCEESGDYFLCYNGAKFLEYNPELDRVVDQYYVVVKKKVADLQVLKRTVSDSNPYPWEEVTITTKFTNSGLADIQQLNFTESFPESIIVTEANICSSFNNTVAWTGSLGLGKEIICTYKIKMLGNGTYNLFGKFDYSSGGKISSLNTETLVLTITQPDIDIHANLTGPKDPVIGDKLTAIYNITNIGQEDFIMLTNFEVKPPNDNNVISTTRNLVKEGNVYKFSGRITRGEPVLLNITFQAKTVGIQYIASTATYFISSKRIEIDRDMAMNVTIGHITTQIKNWNLTAGVNNTITILARNTGERDRFRDITMTVRSEIKGMNTVAEIGELLRRNHKEAAVLTFVPPDVDVPTKFPVTIEFDYDSVFDQPLHSEYNISITINPRNYADTPEKNTSVEESLAIPTTTQTFGEVVKDNTPVFIGIAVILVMTFLLITLMVIWKKRKARAYTFEDLLKDEDIYKESPESKKADIIKKIEDNKNKES